MIWGAEWWDALQAFGTVGAVVISLGLAAREGFRARRAEQALAAERVRSAAVERRTVASLVSGWTESTYIPSPNGSHFVRQVTAYIANESNEPVYNLHAVIAYGEPAIQVGPLSLPVPIPVLPARHRRSWDVTTGLLAHSSGVGQVPTEPVLSMDFKDSQGSSWRRKFDGSLEQDPRKPMPPVQDEGQKQLGPINNDFNPVYVATAFMALLDQADSTEDLKPALSPTAKGWRGLSRVEFHELRDQLHNYGMAAHVWYPTPRVAYIRLVHDEDIEKARAGGSARVQFITLTFLAGKGWSVFSVGPAVTEPDWIEFPRKDLIRDLRG
jgi:hypothetical protein